MALKLTYFDIRGRGEISRLVLHAAKKKFEDHRIGFADWPALKPKTPYGGLPVLEYDGEMAGQGIAIATYLARVNGLYGKNNKEAFLIDQIQQCREDLVIEETKGFMEKDAAKKAEIEKNLRDTCYPRYLNIFNTIIEKNQKKTKSQFTVGAKLSLADIAIFEGTQTLSQTNPDLLEKYPLIKNLRTQVAELDGIKQYLANRKTTPL